MSEVQYAWKANRSFKIAAQIVGEELEQIEKEDGGRITPVAVVERAKSSNSVLHSFFEWDDSKAAEQHRLWQARSLIGAVVVRSYKDQETKPVRAFVNVSGEEGREYLGIVSVMSDDEKRAAMLRDAKEELEEWRERYRGLQEFARVFDAIDQLNAA